jgi:hypothetical protein
MVVTMTKAKAGGFEVQLTVDSFPPSGLRSILKNPTNPPDN